MKGIRSISIRTGLLAALLAAAGPALGAFQVPPRPRGALHDGAGVVRPEDARAMEGLSRLLWQKAEVALVVATLPDLGGEPVEDVSIRIANTWGVGGERDDRGILIVVSVGDRRARIEVGYGAEGYLPDGLVGEILDREMIPHFRRGDYSSGLRAAATRIALLTAAEYGFDLEGVGAAAPDRERGGRRPSLLGRILGPLLLIALIIIGIRNPWLLLFLLMSGRGGGHHRGGFGGGGFGGGGFGGFGGGSFGGGGASRGW